MRSLPTLTPLLALVPLACASDPRAASSPPLAAIVEAPVPSADPSSDTIDLGPPAPPPTSAPIDRAIPDASAAYTGPHDTNSFGTSLTAGQIEPVVRAHGIAVKQECWGTRRSPPPSANVTVTMTIDATGHVADATSSGNDPMTGTCLERAARRWVFPATGAQSTVAIPFHFVAVTGDEPVFPVHVPPNDAPKPEKP